MSPRRRTRAGTGRTASFELRSQIIDAVRARVERLGLSQVEAARVLGITAPRMNLLVHGRAEFFSLDMLVELAVRLDLKVSLRVTRPYAVG